MFSYQLSYRLDRLLITLLASKHASKLLQNMLHATCLNKRHSLHDLLHSMLYTCFIAHVN
jgi:hypothetical protein